MTKIRVNNPHIISPQTEIICYPITNVTRPLDLFGPFPKTTQSYVPLSPPAPPSRKSSKRNTTLKIFSDIHAKSDTKKNTAKNRSKSATSLLSTYSSSLKEEKNFANHSRIARNQFRVSSVSPVGRISKSEQRKSSASPIAFGRSISKERTFAEEKKRLEQQHPLCRRTFTASTSILRNPDLKSPDEVKRAIKTTFKMPSGHARLSVSKSTRKTGSNGSIKSSAVNYSINKFENGPNTGDEKSMRLSVAMSSRATAPLTTSRSTARTPISVIQKSNITRSSRSTESRYTQRSRQFKLSGSTSNLSIARTSSTYSIDSVASSKKKVPPITITSSRELKYQPLMVSSKTKKKKSTHKEETNKQSIVTKPGKDRHDSINEGILNNNQLVRSDTFFQNLLLRDYSPVPPVTITRSTSVQEKARNWDNNQIDKPAQKNLSVYLTQKRAVTDSKFRSLENEQRVRYSRSLSPQRIFKPNSTVYYNHVSKYDSFIQLTDEEEEFGKYTENRSTTYEERSHSEPKILLTEVIHPNSPVVIHGKQSTDRRYVPPAPKDIRSPSCRRIQSFKANQRSENNRIARARSLGSTDRYHSLDSHILSRSACSMDTNYEMHAPICMHRQSERFRDLNKFYSNLERVGQLEKATSSTDLRPIRKEGEIIDYDVWKQIRTHEKAEKELNVLVDKIKRDEKEKDLLFRPKYHEDHKWNERNDSGLRIKEKSVEDLKEILKEKSMQDDLDSLKHQEVETSKGKYKSLWRGNSVLDLATSMVDKFNPATKSSTTAKKVPERRFGLSKKLISTLSRDQISKIKHQLSEIYSNNFGGGQKAEKKIEICDKYFVDVPDDGVKSPTRGLTVRRNSLVLKEELLGPILKRQQKRLLDNYKAESIGSIHEPRVSRSVDRYEDIIKKEQKQLSESEKRNILHNLSKEIQNKLNEKRQKSIVYAKETRGAIASTCARNTLPKTQKPSGNKTTTRAAIKEEIEVCQKPVSVCDTESVLSKQTMITSNENISEKIQYFEKKKDDIVPETTIYHAREYSSPDEEEVMRIVEENMKIRRAAEKRLPQSPQGLSSSVSDFKELFGETSRDQRSTPSPSGYAVKRITSPSKPFSTSTSIESVFRSRSVSPQYESKHMKHYFNTINTGDVRKMKDKFESLTYTPRSKSTDSVPPRRFRSDPELNKINRTISPSKILVRNHEVGDVSWITHKFETKNCASRGRSKNRKVISPIPKVSFKKNDRFMPHIDIISKTAALKQEIRRKSPSKKVAAVWNGEVERIKNKFESSSPDRLSLLGQMYTSSPDISELRDISTYLSGSWVAHKYPKTRDNSRSPVCPDNGPVCQKIKKRQSNRPSSTSPPRSKSGISPLIKPFYNNFANDDLDLVKQPRRADKRVEAEFIWRKLQNKVYKKPSVKFEGFYEIEFLHLYLHNPSSHI